MSIKNFFGHLHTVNKHRAIVFYLSCKAGIPWRGFVHDLSKYSPIEFFESVKYYNGKHSPIRDCKQEKGYSEAWLHHKGRNKHHFEYWYDYAGPVKTPVIPYKYAVESICDCMAAGIVYSGKDWTKSTQYDYWTKSVESGKIIVNEKTKNFYERVYKDISIYGINKVINKKNLKKLYNEYCR